MKLDSKFEGEIRKVKDGTILRDEEYVVFLAKDNAFAAALPVYRAICVAMGADQGQIRSLDRMIVRLNKWREDHPYQCKVPDVAKGERLLA
jgi:hypothetical protein